MMVLAWVAIILSCAANHPAESELSPDLPFLEEAQDMALYYSGELRPPKGLTRQISRELYILRMTWWNSIPGVYTSFVTPWHQTGRVELSVDDTALASIMDGQNMAWDEICEKYNLTYGQILKGFRTNAIGVSSEDPLHPQRLAELFAELPYVNSVYAVPRGWYGRPLMVRFDDGGASKYFICVFCLGEIYYTYYYFVVDSAAAHLIGEFSRCPPNQDSLWANYSENLKTPEPIYDSIWQTRPAWVDTAGHHFGDLHRWRAVDHGHGKLSK